jgi:hypothetical protein
MTVFGDVAWYIPKRVSEELTVSIVKVTMVTKADGERKRL